VKHDFCKKEMDLFSREGLEQAQAIEITQESNIWASWV
jgi:hypothetical protein